MGHVDEETVAREIAESAVTSLPSDPPLPEDGRERHDDDRFIDEDAP